MSQYPSPYSPPPQYPQQPPGFGYYTAPPDSLAAGRRASVVMFVIGGLVLLLSSCNTIATLLVPAQQLLDQQRKMMPTGSEPPWSAETLKTVGITFGVIMMLVGAAFVSLGTGVRRGSAGSTITALVLAGVLLLIVGLFSLLAMVAASAQPVLLPLACVVGVMALALLVLVVFLVGALRAGRGMLAGQQQVQGQYWQYQQNMQAYGGYHAPLTPPPPPPQVPPSDQNQGGPV